MFKKYWFSLSVILTLAALLFGLAQPRPTAAQGLADGPTLVPQVSTDLRHDTSIALMDMTPLPAPAGGTPERYSPQRSRFTDPAGINNITDPAIIQTDFGLQSIPAPLNNFNGVMSRDNVHPPDTNGDIGPNHYMQWVNLSLQIWDKDGNSVYGPVAGNTIWSGFGGPCETTNNGDPIVLYDELAGRWFISQFSVNSPYYQCIAVSQTDDPTGAWHRYQFLYSSSIMNDYPKFGVWPDGYYMSANQFYGDYGVGVVVYERTRMLQGLSARQVYFNLNDTTSWAWALLPSDYDGTPPPAGEPNYFLSWDDGGTSDAIHIWEFHVDWVNTANSTFGLNGQPNRTIATANLDPSMCYGDRDCIPQLGSTTGLDAIAGQAMYRAQYRNFGTYATLVSNVTVDAGGDRAGVYWFELRDTGSGFNMHQQGVFAPEDGNSRWMGSAAMDVGGDIALVYSVSSANMHPAIRYAGRLATDPLGEMTQGEAELFQGPASSTSTYYRWGDYSMISLDPLDGCTFWMTSEYYATTGVRTWGTRIGSFRFPSCAPAAAGTLEGLVTDVDTGAPIADASVAVGPYVLLTGPDGSYSTLISEGTYDVTVSAEMYLPATVSVIITEGATTTQDFALQPRPASIITGTVTDGGEHPGMPIYARIEVTGSSKSPVFTNPVTGAYSIQLVEGLEYTFTVSPITPGYAGTTRQVTAPAGGGTEDFALIPDLTLCNAPGYRFESTGLFENFESGSLPQGWAIEDLAGTGEVWRFDNPGNRANNTGGSGGFAIADSGFYGGTGHQDTILISPLVDLSTLETVDLQFNTDYDYRSGDFASADVSNNGGATWHNVWYRSSDARGPLTVTIDISSLAAGQNDVQVRFHYGNGSFDFFWAVDNVMIGQAPECVAVDGGLIAGQTRDANTDELLDDTIVSSAADQAVSFATPDDPNLGDGYYILFVPANDPTVSATHVGGYGILTQEVTISPDEGTAQDLALPAGLVTADPIVIARTLGQGMVSQPTVTLNNSGSAAAPFTVVEMSGLPLPAPQPTGPFAAAGRHVGPKRLSEPTGAYVPLHDYPDAPDWPDAGALLGSLDTGLQGTWALGLLPDGSFWVGSILPTGGDGQNHHFINGTATDEVMDTNFADPWAADLAYNARTGMLWQVGLTDGDCIYELDPATGLASGNKLCPGFGVSQRALAYDPLSDTFYSGSWNDAILYHFDTRGRMLDSINLDLEIAGLAFNPDSGHLFVLQSAPASAPDVYVLDPAQDYALLGRYDIPALGDYAAGGVELGCNGSLWIVDQTSNQVLETATGETQACTWADVSWLSTTPVEGTLAAGSDSPVQVMLNAGSLPAGTYEAHLIINTETPYAVEPVQITLTIVDGVQRIFMPVTVR